MSSIQLVALDLDGTLFNDHSRISEENLKAIREITDRGVHAVISTGRPLSGIPYEQMEGSGIRYAITTNGSAVYDIPTQTCIYEDGMEGSLILPILDFLYGKDIHMDAFIGGKAYSPLHCLEAAKKLTIPESIKRYILETRIRLKDLSGFIRDNHLMVQKMTLNFYPDRNGVPVDRQAVKEYLLSNPDVLCVSGGYNNLEFTKAGVTKGVGLARLAEYLHIPLENTIAIGDTENDMAIIETAGIGIAMGNATPAVKAIADDITLSNEEDGVAAAIRKYI